MTVAARLLIMLGLSCPSVAFSTCIHQPSLSACSRKNQNTIGAHSPLFGTHTASASLFDLRGGDQAEAEVEEAVGDAAEAAEAIIEEAVAVAESETRFSLSLAPMTSSLAAFGAAYGASLEKRPIATKSVTACAIFGLSDWLAQRLERTEDGTKKSTNWTRTMSSALVGLFYFGPAAHYWYETIFRILPGTSLVSTLQKAGLGQLLFGPSFTCIFFATSLSQQGKFSLANWGRKIRSDLPGAWAAGLGFWPLVDLVSYSMIPKEWIPLFVNTCSLVWTIYLSLVANRQSIARSD